jgi:hypothetical protein
VYLCIRPTQILIVRPERLTSRRRDNLLCGDIVQETMHAETSTLFLRLEHRSAAYDLEMTVPSYVYHRLGLDTDKHIIVELGRQAVHVIPRQSDTGTDAPSPCSGPLTSVTTEAPLRSRKKCQASC